MSKIKQILSNNTQACANGFLHAGISSANNDDQPNDKSHKSNGKEMVAHPDHYNKGDKTYEPYKVIAAWQLNFNIGSSVKYLARYEDKWNPIEDLEKAKQYIDFEIENITENCVYTFSCHTSDDKYHVCKVINAWNLNFSIGSAVECLAEYNLTKAPVDMLNRAKTYIDYEIERLKEKNGCK
jgi:hypothetical protein